MIKFNLLLWLYTYVSILYDFGYKFKIICPYCGSYNYSNLNIAFNHKPEADQQADHGLKNLALTLLRPLLSRPLIRQTPGYRKCRSDTRESVRSPENLVLQIFQYYLFHYLIA